MKLKDSIRVDDDDEVNKPVTDKNRELWEMLLYVTVGI